MKINEIKFLQYLEHFKFLQYLPGDAHIYISFEQIQISKIFNIFFSIFTTEKISVYMNDCLGCIQEAATL